MWKPDYVDLAAQKLFMRVEHTADDTLISQAITAASRAIDDACHRQFGSVDEAVQRRYTPRWRADRGRWIIPIDDLMTDTDLDIAIAGVGSVTVFDLEPVNAAADGKPWEEIAVGTTDPLQPTGADLEASVVGRWGWPDVPAVVVRACHIQTARWSERRDSPYGIAGSPEQGSELRLLAKLDPDVATLLGSVRRRQGPG